MIALIICSWFLQKSEDVIIFRDVHYPIGTKVGVYNQPYGVAFAYRLTIDSRWITVEPGTWGYFISKQEKFDVETMRLECNPKKHQYWYCTLAAVDQECTPQYGINYYEGQCK